MLKFFSVFFFIVLLLLHTCPSHYKTSSQQKKNKHFYFIFATHHHHSSRKKKIKALLSTEVVQYQRLLQCRNLLFRLVLGRQKKKVITIQRLMNEVRYQTFCFILCIFFTFFHIIVFLVFFYKENRR